MSKVLVDTKVLGNAMVSLDVKEYVNLVKEASRIKNIEEAFSKTKVSVSEDFVYIDTEAVNEALTEFAEKVLIEAFLKDDVLAKFLVREDYAYCEYFRYSQYSWDGKKCDLREDSRTKDRWEQIAEELRQADAELEELGVTVTHQ